MRVLARDQLDAIAAELHPAYAPLPVFAAAAGLRPEEWPALERRDVDRRARVLNVVRTVVDGKRSKSSSSARRPRTATKSRCRCAR